jgi:YidC/Oxa1 family membrane protein insertase
MNPFNTVLVYPIFNLLAVLYAFVHDFGLAIVLLTVLIRLLIWPLVTRQLHSQRALQELQPELKRIKEQAAGDRTLEGQLTMELYKEREINPFASFLPLLIQLPIFFALFVVLKDIVMPGKLAQIAYPFVAHLSAIAAIISHKAAFHPTLFGVIDLTKPSPLLAAMAALVQFVQTKQITPKHTPGDQQAQLMSGMVYVFPALTFFIGLSLPSALPLYWFTSSGVAVFQQFLVLRRDVKELEDGTPASAAVTPSQVIQPPAHKSSKGKKKRKKTT